MRLIRAIVPAAFIAFGVMMLLLDGRGPTSSRVEAQSVQAASVACDGPVDCEAREGAQSVRLPLVWLIEIDRAIDSVTERFLLREIELAENSRSPGRLVRGVPTAGSGPDTVVIRLNTPGGSLDSTRAIVTAMLAADVPIVVWVGPAGAHAASAGTFIGAAAHVLVMAQGTQIGAASVVSLTGDELSDTAQRKANEDAAGLMRSIATVRGRDVDALDATVFDATAYTATEAMEQGIADLIADDIDELFDRLESALILIDGERLQFNFYEAEVREVQLGMLERFLTVVANPSLAFLFISLGGIGLIVELWNFGTWIPGILGVIFLILGFTGVGQLSFEWAGIALIVVALVLLTLELTLAPGLGIFGIAGVIVLITGGLFLFPVWDTPDLPGAPGIVNRWMLGGMGAVMLAGVLLIVREIRKDQEAVPYTSAGASSVVVGQIAEVETPLTPIGSVRIAGESWSATSEVGNAEVGDRVEVTAIDGVTLKVQPLSSNVDDEDETPA